MRIGINGNRLVATGSVAEVRRHAAGVAAAGLDGYWLAQHPAGSLDAVTALALVASDLPPIELGTGVVPIWGRHPAALAAQALTANQAIPGRLTLGIGLSHPALLRDHLGIDHARPVRQMREFLEVLGPLLRTGRVHQRGEVFSYDHEVAVVEPRPVEVLVAAMGSQLLRVAGTHADGTLVSWTGPNTLRDHVIPTISAAAADAGRPAPRIAAIYSVAITDDVERALAQVDEWFAFHGDAPSYRAMMEREGAASARDIAIVGDEETLRRRVEELAAVGVTDVVLGEVVLPGDDGERTRQAVASLAEGLRRTATA